MSPRALQRRLSHALAQIIITNERCVIFRAGRHIHRRGRADSADIATVVQLPQGMPLCQFAAAAGRRQPYRGAKPGHTVQYGIAVAIPVADHRRQSRGHGLHRGLTEGFLNIVRQRCEQIGAGPGRGSRGRISRIQKMTHHSWTIGPG